MVASIQVDIVSIEGQVYSGQATLVSVPGVLGRMGVMIGHAPLLTGLKPGAVRVTIGPSEQRKFFISGGILEVQPDLVTVLADTVVHAETQAEMEAVLAKRNADNQLKETSSRVQYSQVASELVRAAEQLQEMRRRVKKQKIW